MPIRIRLALGFAVAALIIFGVSGVLFERSFRNGVEKSLDPGLRAQTDTLARALHASGGADVGLNEASTTALVRTRELVAQVLDGQGRLLETTREAGARRIVTRAEASRATETTIFVQEGIDREREPFRLLARATDTSGGTRIVVVGTSLEATNEAVDRVDDALLFGGIAVVIVAGAGAWVLAGAALRPVERMRRQAAAISERDPSPQLPVPATRDELAALGSTLNDLLARLRSALERERQFVADAGHELRTPLAILRTELELASRRPRSHDELMATVIAAQRETERIARLTDELLFLASTDDAPAVPRSGASISPILEEAVASLEAEADERSVRVELDADRSIEASVAPALLRRAVENLLENALRYAPEGSTVLTRLRHTNGQVVVDVLDDGPGFPQDFLAHAFERFRRADDARSRGSGGTGLGLAIVAAVARAHGGEAVAANRPDGGAAVGIRIPAPA
ncbi:MAG: ATP-binding protein [Acidimicrobiia bacterium]